MELAKSLGKAFIISGLLPALIFAIPNVFLFMGGDLDLKELEITPRKNVFGVLLMGVVVLAVMLLVLNTPIVRTYEGSYRILRFLFRHSSSKNLLRHETMYKSLQAYKEEYDRTEDDAKRNSLAHAIQQEWRRILPERDKFFIPMDKRRISPTRLGNVFAAIEEYPSIRYGMDGMVFWPRLISVIPKEYADVIANERISFNFLINLSLLSGIFSIEMFAKYLWNPKEFEFLLLTVLLSVLFYVFYRVSIIAVITMGDLIKSCFDLFRHDILRKMNIGIPDRIEEERVLWFRLSNYMSSGELFYYPGNEKRPEQGEE